MSVKYSDTWMGDVPLATLWPWASLVMVLPGIYLLRRLYVDLLRHENSERFAWVLKWFGLLGMAASTVAIAGILGYGRGSYPTPWESRYCVFAAPIAIALYFLLVRSSAPALFTGGLAIWMAVCVGWNLPAALSLAQSHKSCHSVLVKELRRGHISLSILAERQPAATGWSAEWGIHNLLGWWCDMRSKGISAFAKVHGKDQDPATLCVLLPADSGTLDAGLHNEPDAAFRGRCVMAETVPARAVYAIEVPRGGSYRLCCRWKVTQPGQMFTVAVDDELPVGQPVQPQPGFSACEYGRPLALSAGKHQLAITWPGQGSRMDVLELTPQ